jgi:hypothetical protein
VKNQERMDQGGGGEGVEIHLAALPRAFPEKCASVSGQGQRQMVLALINTVFAQDTQEAAITQWRAVADQLREKFPKLAVLMDEGRIRCAGLHELPEGTSRTPRPRTRSAQLQLAIAAVQELEVRDQQILH